MCFCYEHMYINADDYEIAMQRSIVFNKDFTFLFFFFLFPG